MFIYHLDIHLCIY